MIGQIGVERKASVAPAPPDLARLHPYHQQRTVGHPAEARGAIIELKLGTQIARQIDRTDPVGIEIREPQPPPVPARPLAEIDCVGEGAQLPAGHVSAPRDR